MSREVCAVQQVVKAYRGKPALGPVSISVGPAQMIAISGPSGSGKSTLLNILGLLEKPDGGRVRLFGGQAPRQGSRAAMLLLRRRLAYLFQNFALVDNATVAENLRIAQRFATGSRSAQQEAQRRALERVGMTGSERVPVFQLSGGEQQRVAMARLFVKPCELILADEPTGSLDPANRDRILDSLHALRQEGKTIILVTHDPYVARSCDDQIALAPAQPHAPRRP